MNIAEIITCDSANGPGMRVSVFVSGCEQHCKGCFNQEAWNPDYGKPYTSEILSMVCNELDKSWCSGLSVLGGEPMESYNIFGVADFVQTIHQAYPDKSIWVYTGKLYEDLVHQGTTSITRILHAIDVLVDGPFIEEYKDPSLPFRGSSNQRIIDVKETMLQGRIVLHEKMNKEPY